MKSESDKAFENGKSLGDLLIGGFLIGMTIFKISEWLSKLRQRKTEDQELTIFIGSRPVFYNQQIPVQQQVINVKEQPAVANHTTISSYVGNDSLW
jgi:hypothetical protein